ncbi:MAG: universal stress protein, partial [Halobacteriota archaeon]
LATDGSPNARAATDRALSLAAEADGSLHVIYVVEFIPAFGRAGAPWLLSQGVKREEMLTRGEHVIDVVEMAANERDIPCTSTVTSGLPHQLIVEQAADVDADVVVMGKTERRGMVERFWGSTADRVIDRVTAPVLLVGSPDDHR